MTDSIENLFLLIISRSIQSICAQVGKDACCDWVGEEGSGHYVKMVHNGIEYGDMQLIAEAYNIMKDMMDLSHREMADIFADWNATELDSFLIEITSNILRFSAFLNNIQ